MFEKSLTDLVRGIRNHKKDETKYISQCIQEIKEELKQDMQKKTVAIQKLTYLQMLGYDISWASFNIVEVMSQPKFTGKRIGYLAASQSFHAGTEVVVLATQLLKKDFNSSNQYEAGTAINTLANIATPDLARDLATDIVALMSNSKPYIRKKAVLVMYKIFLNFPDSLRPSFPKLKEKLDDSDQSVISSAVNVVCELARKNPKNYLSLAPVLFKLLTSNYNNWMLIKIIKLFGALTPYEPRLAKKLVDPLSNLINTTPAMSLIYECIQTCTIGMAEHLPVIKLCIAKLRTFVEDPDQNLKYLGLLALNNIMKIHPKAVAEHRDLVLNCLDDEDVTIRLRALDLLTGMVTKRNLPEIVRKLLEHIERAEGNYRDELVNKIVTLSSQSTYAYITDFEWYITVLVQLTHVHGTTHGALIATQMLDVLIRVKVVRPFGVKQMAAVLRDPRLLSNPEINGVCEALYAAAWSVGEFARYLDNPLETIDALLQPRVTVLPAHIQGIYMHTVLKVFVFLVAAAYGEVPEDEGVEGGNEIVEVTPEQITEASDVITSRLTVFTESVHLEVQERACFALEVLRLYNKLKDQDGMSAELVALFEEPLNPVAKGAIKKVPIPEGLDLDTPLNEEPPEESDEEDEPAGFGGEEEDEEPVPKSRPSLGGDDDEDEDEDDIWSTKPSKQAQQQQQQKTAANKSSNPFYIQARAKPQASAEEAPIPVVSLPQTLGKIEVGSPKKQIITARVQKKAYTIVTTEELPEGAATSDDEKKQMKKMPSKTGADALSEISLAGPLGDDEILPVQRHRTDIQREQQAKEAATEKARQAKEKRERGGRPSRGGEEVKEGERRRRPREEGERRRRPQTEGSLVDLGGETPDYQELSSPATPAPLEGVVEEKKRRPRPDGERRPRPDGERHRRPRPDGERERRPRPEGERPRRPSDKQAADAPTAAAPAASRGKLKLKPLVDGEDIRVAYDVRASNEKGKLEVFLIIANKSETEIPKADVNFTDSMNVRMARSAAGAPSEIGEIAAGGRTQHQITLSITNISMAQKLKGVISYEYLGDSRKQDFQLTLPVSSFLVGVTLSKEQFAECIKSSSLFGSTASVKVQGDFKTTVTAITDLTHAEIVQLSANVASAYARTALGQHFGLLIKEKSDGNVSVDIRTAEQAVANAVVQELNAMR